MSLEEIKRQARAALEINGDDDASLMVLQNFHRAANPKAVLNLIDILESENDIVKAMVKLRHRVEKLDEFVSEVKSALKTLEGEYELR